MLNNHNDWTQDVIRKSVAIVPQEDILFPNLTIIESLFHSVRTKSPLNYSFKQIMSITCGIIRDLSISHIENKLLSDINGKGISGN